MRVRPLPLRSSTRRSQAQRRPPHVEQPAAPEPPAATPAEDPGLLAERRHRASIVPEDLAHYRCACGFQFQAAVSTSVACPHCGTSQAW